MSPASAAGQPVLAASFDPAQVAVGGTTQLTFTIATPVDSAAGQDAFWTWLPWGLDVAAGTSGACGGTLTTTSAQPGAPGPYPTPPSAAAAIGLQGGTVSPGSICQFSVPVIATDADDYTVTAALADAGRSAATTSLTVNPIAQPPEVAAAFSPSRVPTGQESSLIMTITNPNPTPLTGLWFYYQSTDSYYQGAGPPTPQRVGADTCGGQAYASENNGAVLPPSMGLGYGAIPAFGRCQVTFVMNDFASGVTRLPVTVHSAQGSDFATADVTRVEPPPLVNLRIVPARIRVAGVSRLRITITNQNETALNGLAFIDVLPAGLRLASRTKSSDTCGGTLVARPRSATVGLLNASLHGRTELPSGSLTPPTHCVITVKVGAIATGSFRDSTGRVTAADASDAHPATARVTIVPKRTRR